MIKSLCQIQCNIGADPIQLKSQVKVTVHAEIKRTHHTHHIYMPMWDTNLD